MSLTTPYMPQSKSDIHITPNRVFDIIWDNWGHTKDMFFDPCPIHPTFDGLKIPWKNLNFVNPPYSLLREFVFHSIREMHNDKETILLLPSKTDQQWFHDLLSIQAEIIWIKKRLKFTNNKWSATQPHFLARVS